MELTDRERAIVIDALEAWADTLSKSKRSSMHSIPDDAKVREAAEARALAKDLRCSAR